MPSDEAIDWAKVRARIAATPVVFPPPKKTRKDREAERLERKKRKAREKWRRNYIAHREECIARQRAWEKAHPDKVKAKKKRYYAIHKADPEWMDKHRRQNREYKARRRERERMALESGQTATEIVVQSAES